MTPFRARSRVGVTFAAAAVAAVLGVTGAGPANAVPALQLDIVGGVYDQNTETIVAPGNSFSLLALATPGGNVSAADILAETYFVSVAILPPVVAGPGFDAGSFEIDGMTIAATDASLTFGTPPADAAHNSDLPGHGIFPTYYYEIAFQFDAAHTAASYNSGDDAGGQLDETGSSMFFAAFEIDVSDLEEGHVLHFDLYNTKVKYKKGDAIVSIDDKAPFSHDAQSSPPVESDEIPPVADVPEPGTLAVFLAGLGIIGFGLRRQRRAA